MLPSTLFFVWQQVVYYLSNEGTSGDIANHFTHSITFAMENEIRETYLDNYKVYEQGRWESRRSVNTDTVVFDIDDPPKGSYMVADGPIVDRNLHLKMFKWNGPTRFLVKYMQKI